MPPANSTVHFWSVALLKDHREAKASKPYCSGPFLKAADDVVPQENEKNEDRNLQF